MIRRFLVLSLKELLQQRWVLLSASAVLLVMGSIAWIDAKDQPAMPTDLAGASALLIFFVPLLCLVLGHRMVVREYQAHTQLFVEALPLRLWEMLLAKYIVGLLGACLPAIAFVLTFAVRSSETAPLFWLILTLRTLGYALVSWSLFFGVGLLGRLRIPAYFTLGLALVMVANTTSFELERFGPIALIDSATFPYERSSIPLRALLECVLLSLAFLGMGALVALVREGSIAEKLSRRASPTEIVAITVLLSAEAVTAAWLSDRHRLAPFEFTSNTVLHSRRGGAQIMYGWSAFEARAAIVAEGFDELSLRLAHELAGEEQPPIRLAHNSLLEGREVRTKSTSSNGGVLLEANLGSTDFELQRVLEAAAHQIFIDLSRTRASFEPNHWFLDGFSAWWSSEGHPESREQLWLRALVAARGIELDTEATSRWERTTEALGEGGASALAFTLVDVLAQRHGRSRVLELARAVLVRRAGPGISTWLAEREFGLEERFRSVTGEPWTQFVGSWRSDLQRMSQGPFAVRLASIPNDHARIRIEPSGSGADVVFDLWGPSLTTERRCALLHVKLDPYDQAVPDQRLKRRAIVWKANQVRSEGRAHGLYRSGDRALLVVECHATAARAEVRLVAERREMP